MGTNENKIWTNNFNVNLLEVAAPVMKDKTNTLQMGITFCGARECNCFIIFLSLHSSCANYTF